MDWTAVGALVLAYVGIGIVVARYMGGDRSHLSPDVTYLDWLGFLMIVLFWPFIPLLILFSFIRDLRSH